MFLKTQKEIVNSKAISLPGLNWSKNPTIREAAERLGIFENPPNSMGLLNLDVTKDLVTILEEVGIIDTELPIRESSSIDVIIDIENILNPDNLLDIPSITEPLKELEIF